MLMKCLINRKWANKMKIFMLIIEFLILLIISFIYESQKPKSIIYKGQNIDEECTKTLLCSIIIFIIVDVCIFK